MNGDPPIDDTATCPACEGSGAGAADTSCGFCGGCGGVPLEAAQKFETWRRHHVDGQKLIHFELEPVPFRYSVEGKQRVLDSLDAIGDTFMIQWLTGVGRFDTNDPCDEWSMP